MMGILVEQCIRAICTMHANAIIELSHPLIMVLL